MFRIISILIFIIFSTAYAQPDSLWSRTFDGFGEHDEGNCIIETNDGNILVGGVIGAPAPVYGYGFLSYSLSKW